MFESYPVKSSLVQRSPAFFSHFQNFAASSFGHKTYKEPEVAQDVNLLEKTNIHDVDPNKIVSFPMANSMATISNEICMSYKGMGIS